jgi:flagellar basal-body rod protein FlgG
MRTLSIASTGMLAQQTNVEVISNNIANINTTGFKRARADFQDLLYQASRRQGAVSAEGVIQPAGIELGLGVRNVATTRNHSQGSLTSTGNTFDLALEGRGFFQVTMPDGTTAYTRAGNFQVNAEGTLVTADGYQVNPGIAVPQNTKDIVINKSGQVLAYVEGAVEPQDLGRLSLSNFTNEAGLEAMGDNLYRATPASGDPVDGLPGDPGFASIRQGFLEGSNVSIVQEITSLITAQRAYEMNSKVVEAADQMSQTTNNIR